MDWRFWGHAAQLHTAVRALHIFHSHHGEYPETNEHVEEVVALAKKIDD
jgi:hypothetical protein